MRAILKCSFLGSAILPPVRIENVFCSIFFFTVCFLSTKPILLDTLLNPLPLVVSYY